MMGRLWQAFLNGMGSVFDLSGQSTYDRARTRSSKQWGKQARSGGQHRHPASTMPPPMASSLDPNEGLRRDAEKIEGDWRRAMGLHPLTDPGDGRTQCEGCNQYVWPIIHSCKGIKQ